MIFKESIGYTMIKSCHMVFKGVNCVHNDKIRSNGLESSQPGTQYKNWGQMVLKGVKWVHNTKIRSYGLGRSQLGTICKTTNNIKVS